MNKNFKATKTVLAVAVASLMAGGVFAADDTATDTVVNADKSVSISFQGKAPASADAVQGEFVKIESNTATVKDHTGAFGATASANFTLTRDDHKFTVANGSLSGFTGKVNETTDTNHGLLFTVGNGETLALTGMSISDNEASDARGMIRVNGGMLTVEDSSFTGNAGVLGGALNLVKAEEGTKISNTTFSGNEAGSHGGAAYVTGGTVAFENVSFSGNKAGLQGGALEIVGGKDVPTTVTLKDVTFSGNSSTMLQGADKTNGFSGGAVMVNSAETKLTGENVVFTGNKAETSNGGALAVANGGEASIVGGSFSANSAATGGAVGLWNGTATFTDVDFRNNTATGWGGAVRADNESTIKFAAVEKDVVIAGNTAGDADTDTGMKYGYTGGFLHLQAGSDATFNVAEDRTMTIGTSASAKNVDTITSVENTSTINKTGDGKLVINSSTEAFAGTFNVQGGSVELATGIGEFSILNIAKGSEQDSEATSSTFNVESGASASIGKVTATKYAVTYAVKTGADLTINAISLQKDNNLKLNNAGELHLGDITVAQDAAFADSAITNSGAIYTSYKNLVTLGEEADWSDATLTAFGEAYGNAQTGSLYETDFAGRYTLEQLKKAESAFGNFSFSNVNATAYKIVDGKEVNVTLNEAKGHNLGHTVVDQTGGTIQDISGEGVYTSVGAVNFVQENADTPIEAVTISNTQLALTGESASGKVFKGYEGQIDFSGSIIQFGSEQVDVTVSNDLTLSGNTDVTLVGNTKLTGEVVADTEKDSITVQGNATIHAITGGTVTVDDGILFVEDFVMPETNGLSTLANGAGESQPIQPITPQVAAAPVTTDYVVNKGTNLSLFAPNNQTAVNALTEAYNRLGEGYETGLYLGKAIVLGDAGISVGGTSTTNGQFDVAANSFVVMDLNAIARTGYNPEGPLAIVNAASSTLSNDAQVVLTGLNNKVLEKNGDGNYVLHSGLTGLGTNNLSLGTHFYTKDADQFVNGDYTFIANQTLLDKYQDFNLYYVLENAVKEVTPGQNAMVDAIFYGDLNNEDWNGGLRDRVIDELNIATNMAVASGAFSAAVDINNEVWKALDRRMTLANLNAPRAAYGVTPWFDVIGTTNEAKDIFGGAGYEADLYGAVLGADWTAPCGAIVGLAFSVGQADGNSVDLGTKVDNDADFYGISLYGSHQIGSFNGKIDIGYVSVSNDLSTHTMLGKFDESLDADIFTMGLGAEYLVKAGSLNVVPHAGIRWSRIDMDDSKYGADYDAMNLFQMPMGVTFSGTFDMTGWKVAPMIDLSVVPAFGDKDAVATYTGGIEDTTRVVDTNPIQMTLGVNAQVDAWTFGVNYGLTAGGDERLNNSFNLNARYTF